MLCVLLQRFQVEAYRAEAVITADHSRMGIFHPAVIEIAATVGKGPFTTLETRRWMEELGVEASYTLADGDCIFS